MEHIPKIVITGGPCAGKSTGLAAISQYLSERGFHPLIVQESATDLIKAGLDPASEEFQEIVLKRQFQAEHQIVSAAQSSHYTNPVMLLDRGLNDGRAYCFSETFEKVLKTCDLTAVAARDMYDGVIHMTTAAYGAEAFYTTKNNTARRETVQQAQIQDDKTREAWHGTPHLRVVRNLEGQSFDDKIKHVLRELSRILGIPEPLECERKFKLLNPQDFILPASSVSIDIVQTYLVSRKPQAIERVRARGQHDQWVFYNTIKEPIEKGLVSERDKIITREQYDNLLVRENTQLRRIHKTRHCFTFEGHYCELDVFKAQLRGMVELEIEVQKLEDPIEIPDFLGPVIEVTGDASYSNYEKAQILPAA